MQIDSSELETRSAPTHPSHPRPEDLPGIGLYPNPYVPTDHDGRQHPYRPVPQYQPTIVHRDSQVMPARPRELLAALALVAMADVAVWRSSDLDLRGTGAAIFFVAVPALVVAAARARRFTLRLCVMLGMFAAIAVRCAYAPTAGTVGLGIALVFALAITLRTRAAHVTDVAASFGATFATIPHRFVAAMVGVRRALFGTGGKRQGSFAPYLIPLALVSLFGGIFALANPLVGRWLRVAVGSAEAPPLLRVMSWFPLLAGAVLLLRPALRRSTSPEALDTTTEAASGSMRIARNALYALNALFLAYNALDAKYLWAGSPPPGVSERDYAHEGAAWLTVAIAALTVVVGVMFRGALAHDARARATRFLAFAWLGQGVVVALGTYRRLFIHIATSGVSSLRILGIVGTTMVVVGLAQMCVKILRRRSFAWLLRRQLDAVALGLFGFCLLPAHRISAPLNLQRVLAHDYQALVHVEEEAAEVESAAELLPMLDHDDVRIRRGIAALLLNERDALRKQTARDGFRDHEIATTRTLAALEAATPKLVAVLGDVDRNDAIIPFEYIRNSSIEGEIAQSEINKVLVAPTRSEKAVKQWIDSRSLAYEVDGPLQIHETSDPNELTATLHLMVTPVNGVVATRRDVTLVLTREKPGFPWGVTEERGQR